MGTEALLSEGPNEEFWDRVGEEMARIYWNPEIERRGGSDVVGPIHKALMVHEPNQSPRVLLNEEAILVVRGRATRALDRGEPVTTADIEEIEDLTPADIHRDAAWAATIVLPDGQSMLAFDFRRNRGRSRDLLDLSNEYLTCAESQIAADRQRSALEALHAAAELAITALMYLQDDDPIKGKRDRHGKRIRWLTGWAKLGNIPEEAARTMKRLGELRPYARYAVELPVEPATDEVKSLSLTVARMLQHARAQIGAPLHTNEHHEPAHQVVGANGPAS
jgi:hypothetical protein